MEQTVVILVGILVAFLVGLFSSKTQSREDAKIIDLTTKIKGNEKTAATDQADADTKVKEYTDALKQYDPDFHSDDDNGGKPSA